LDDAPRQRIAEEGDEVEFYCKASAIPPANVTWFRNGVQLLETDFLNITEGGSKLRMIIPVGTNSSVIQCSAENKYGSVYGSGYLIVGRWSNPNLDSDRGSPHHQLRPRGHTFAKLSTARR
jgi:hypothetical protein